MILLTRTITILRTFPAVLWFLTGATLLNQVGNMAMVFLVIYLTQSQGMGLSRASFALATYAFSVMITGLISGSVIDRFGAPRVIIPFLFLNGIVLLMFLFVSEYSTILFVCLIWGFTYGFYRAASQTFVSILATPGNQKIAFALYRLAINLGMSIGPAIGGYLAGFSYHAIFVANAITNLLAAIVLWIGLMRTPWLSYRPTHSPTYVKFKMNWFWRDTQLRIFLLGLIPVSMVFFQHASLLSVFLYNNLQLPLSFYGLLFTINTLIIVFCEIPLNVATLAWSPRFSLIVGTIFITLGFAGLTFVSQKWQVLLLVLFWTLGEMIFYPSAGTYIAELAAEEHRGSYMSIYSTFSNAGLFIGPWMGAIVTEYFGFHGLWMACAVWGLMSIALFVQLQTPKMVTP